MLQDIWKRLQKKGKQMDRKQQMLLILLVGIFLVVLAIPTRQEEAVEETKTKAPSESYEREETLERKLATILKKIEGAGEVTVMITYENTGEKVVEKDSRKQKETYEEETVYTEENGSGKIPYVTTEKNPKICGVLVVAEGGDNQVVVRKLMEAVQALFDVDTHKIKIVKGG